MFGQGLGPRYTLHGHTSTRPRGRYQDFKLREAQLVTRALYN